MELPALCTLSGGSGGLGAVGGRKPSYRHEKSRSPGLQVPRLRIVALDMLRALAPGCSGGTILEHIVPLLHVVLADPAPAVKAEATLALAPVLAHVGALPAAEGPEVFLRYLFTQARAGADAAQTGHQACPK